MADLEKVKKGLDLCLTGEPARCKDCPYDAECKEARGIGPSPLREDALELLKHDEQTIASLQSTICKLTKAIEEKPEQKFFVDSDGKITPLPVQKHGHWKGFTQSRYFGMDDDGEPIFRDGFFYVCSECRRKSIIKHPYCPRCGARMDEEVKQDG